MPTYTFYTDEYLGNQIAEADFIRLSARAESYINSLGCNLLSVLPNTLDKTICAVAEAWQVNEQGGDVVSQSVGSWSKAYAQKKAKTDSQRLQEAVQLYLGDICSVGVKWL